MRRWALVAGGVVALTVVGGAVAVVVHRGDITAAPIFDAEPHVSPSPLAPLMLSASSPSEALKLAVSSGAPVEDVSQRTATSQVLAAPDGDWILRQYMVPSFVQVGGTGDEDAAVWVPVDYTLEPNADGRLSPVAYPGELSFSAGGNTTEPVASWTIPDTAVTVNLSWQGAELPVGVVDGGRVTYPEVVPGVDVVVDVRPSGFEQFFVIKSRDAAEAVVGQLQLLVSVVGGDVVADEAGGLTVTDADGVVVGSLPAALAWDAIDDAANGSHVLGGWSLDGEGAAPTKPQGAVTANADARWAAVEAGTAVANQRPVVTDVSLVDGGVVVTLEADPAWLNDADTVFPVVVDPLVYATDSSYDTFELSSAGNT